MHHFHQYTPHCPYCCPAFRPGYCPACQPGHYGPSYPHWGQGREGDYERDAIKDRIEALRDELKAMETRLAQLERQK